MATPAAGRLVAPHEVQLHALACRGPQQGRHMQIPHSGARYAAVPAIGAAPPRGVDGLAPPLALHQLPDRAAGAQASVHTSRVAVWRALTVAARGATLLCGVQLRARRVASSAMRCSAELRCRGGFCGCSTPLGNQRGGWRTEEHGAMPGIIELG